ncbi:hypothetical protein AAG906_037061 [Vitis piasezkii]
MFIFPGWVSCKSKEAIPNGVRGWEVGRTHRGHENRALASSQDQRASTGACATGDRGLGHNNMVAAIIPAPMHRIPSELHSEAFLGESSTRMGDLLGSFTLPISICIGRSSI